MWLPQMMGVAPVLLGIASFQTTFSMALQRTGRFFSPLSPFAVGPRHAGQFSATSEECANADRIRAKKEMLRILSSISFLFRPERAEQGRPKRRARGYQRRRDAGC